MHPDKQAKQALTRAIREAGNMRRLSEKTGVCYSIINSFNSGKSNICNIPLGTLMRIFPDLSIRFFKEDGSGVDSRAKDSDCGSRPTQVPEPQKLPG